MDYEKRCKELVEAIKQLQETNPSDEGIQNWANDTLCRVKETDDERIRKALIRYHQSTIDVDGIEGKKIIAWLEKQVKLNVETTFQVWKDMRLEVFAQASGNRHESNCSDECTKMFSLCDIDEIILNITEKQDEKKGAITIDNELYECIRNTCACIDDAMSSKSVVDINDYLEQARNDAYKAFECIEKRMGTPKGNNDKISPKWTDEDEVNWSGIIDEIEANKSEAPDYDFETYDRFLSWLYKIKQRMEEQL